jgi:hypothetical protein
MDHYVCWCCVAGVGGGLTRYGFLLGWLPLSLPAPPPRHTSALYRFQHMSKACREKLKDKLDKAVDAHGLPPVTYGSFTIQTGDLGSSFHFLLSPLPSVCMSSSPIFFFLCPPPPRTFLPADYNPPVSAADVVYAVTALLTCPKTLADAEESLARSSTTGSAGGGAGAGPGAGAGAGGGSGAASDVPASGLTTVSTSWRACFDEAYSCLARCVNRLHRTSFPLRPACWWPMCRSPRYAVVGKPFVCVCVCVCVPRGSLLRLLRFPTKRVQI